MHESLLVAWASPFSWVVSSCLALVWGADRTACADLKLELVAGA